MRPTGRSPERRASALRLWASFPVHAAPRPLVLIGARYQLRGFRTGAAKQAFLAGAVTAGVDLPAGILDSLPPRRAGFTARPITVVAAERGPADFRTDRGPRTLPAWHLTMTDTLDRCVVLSPEVRGWWPSGPESEHIRQARLNEARLAPDGISLEVLVGGGGRDECTRIDFVESETAVIYEPVFARKSEPPPSADGVAVDGLVLWVSRVAAILPSPLGNRVLVDSAGAPVEVAPSSLPWWSPDVP